MRLSPWRARAAALLLAAAPFCAPAAHAEPRLPVVAATDLTGAEIALPADLKAGRTLLLIAFQHEQQSEVDSWLAVAGRFVKSEPDFDYLQLATIGPKNAAARFFIHNGMRSGVTEEAQRQRTITIYDGKQDLVAALALPAEDRIYAVLVNRAGEELWRAEGPATPESMTALKKALQEAS